jgi:hypothetical protein
MVEYLGLHIPQLEVVWDHDHDGGWPTYRRVLDQAGEDGYLHIEDDITITQDLVEKAKDSIERLGGVVPIQFFSIAPVEEGGAPRNGRSFIMTQCFYVPPGHAQAINHFLTHWRVFDLRTGTHMDRKDVILPKFHNPWDTATGEFWRSIELKYWMNDPSLVQHMPLRSSIGHASGYNRCSASFEEPELRGHPYPEFVWVKGELVAGDQHVRSEP